MINGNEVSLLMNLGSFTQHHPSQAHRIKQRSQSTKVLRKTTFSFNKYYVYLISTILNASMISAFFFRPNTRNTFRTLHNGISLQLSTKTSLSLKPSNNEYSNSVLSPLSHTTQLSYSKTKLKKKQSQNNNFYFFHSRSLNRPLIFECYGQESDSDSESTYTKTEESTFDVVALRKETDRLILRCHKKVVKANTRYNNAVRIMKELLEKDDATMEELDTCPNVDALESDLNSLNERLKQLRIVEERLSTSSEDIPKKGTIVLPKDLITLVLDLEINDFPPPRNPSVKKKTKQANNGGGKRLPYRRYYTLDKTEIRVGKKAEDNDQLSCNPEYRDGPDWWMHASGCPGSHVVIRCHDQQLSKDVVMDAAALAARQSKCNGATIKVNSFFTKMSPYILFIIIIANRF